MKHIVESVEEMYHARQPTGEVIVDEVLNILRNYKLIYPEDLALLMDVKVRDLRSADGCAASRCNHPLASTAGTGLASQAHR